MRNLIISSFINRIEESLGNYVQPRLKWVLKIEGSPDESISLLNEALSFRFRSCQNSFPFFSQAIVKGNIAIEFTINKGFLDCYLGLDNSRRAYI